MCISSWSHHDLSICSTSFIPVVYKLHSLIQYSPGFITNVCCRYESRAMFEFKSGLPVYYSIFHKIALDMGIFQIVRMVQMHIGYTSLNFSLWLCFNPCEFIISDLSHTQLYNEFLFIVFLICVMFSGPQVLTSVSQGATYNNWPFNCRNREKSMIAPVTSQSY